MLYFLQYLRVLFNLGLSFLLHVFQNCTFGYGQPAKKAPLLLVVHVIASAVGRSALSISPTSHFLNYLFFFNIVVYDLNLI